MKLEITLMSDLCAGAGKHYSSLVDLDTCLDEYGLPYIPAKRLKGCLKEAAAMIFEQNKIDEIFGVTGSNKGASLSISDAKLEDYDIYVNDIVENKLDDSDVTDLFCSVRSSTAIDAETKTAKDKSLRFVRVVNQHSPIDKKNLKFISDVSIDERFKEDLKKIAKALRNIGYHRNRGLGAVRCIIDDSEECTSDLENLTFDDNCTYVLDYTIRNDGDIMLPNNSADCTMDYIPGTSVLGAFAGLYCKNNYDMDEFNDFFYSNDVKFSNLYITDENQERCLPAARFMAKRKDIRGIFNMLDDDNVTTYKPLKNGYLNKNNSYYEPISKRVYHNAVNSADSSLYMQYCICGGQYFNGTITAKGNKMKVIYELLKKDRLRFGKSKTAQYSNCSVIASSVKLRELPVNDETVTVRAGKIAAYVLRSDAVIVDKNGIEQTSINALANAFGLEFIDEKGKSQVNTPDCLNRVQLHPRSGLALTTISGYNAKWNLKKPHVVAYKAGSVLLFELDKDVEMKKNFSVGEKQNEGFGVVELIEDAKEIKEKVCEQSSDRCTKNNQYDRFPISEAIEETRVYQGIKEFALDKISIVRLNTTQIGRLILMCNEAADMNDLLKRINSIKTKATKENATEIYNIVLDKCEKKYWREYLTTLLTLAKYQKKITKKED